jgi:hypothetical protein
MICAERSGPGGRAARLMPAWLQRLMRHRPIETTMRYYVGFDAGQETAELWRRFNSGYCE